MKYNHRVFLGYPNPFGILTDRVGMATLPQSHFTKRPASKKMRKQKAKLIRYVRSLEFVGTTLRGVAP